LSPSSFAPPVDCASGGGHAIGHAEGSCTLGDGRCAVISGGRIGVTDEICAQNAMPQEVAPQRHHPCNILAPSWLHAV
jgi:hypothetical protein